MYKAENIRSIGVLSLANTDYVRLTPVFEGNIFPRYVHIPKKYYNEICHDEEQLKEYAATELNYI